MVKPMPFLYLGKPIGVIKPDKTFITRRKEIHIFRRYNGLGLSYHALMRLKGLNCKKIIILLELDNGEIEKFETTPENFLEKGQYYTNSQADQQRILSFHQLNQQPLEDYLTKEN